MRCARIIARRRARCGARRDLGLPSRDVDAFHRFPYPAATPAAPAIALTATAAPSPSADDRVLGYTPAAPRVDAERVLRLQGYSDMARVRPPILRAARGAAQAAMDVAAPSVAYRRVPIVDLDRDTLTLTGAVRLHCGAFAVTLAGCTDVIAFVLTLGPAIDERARQLADHDDLLGALLLESAAWLAVEDATRQFRDHLRGEASARGERITSRLGPGYSYRVERQRVAWALAEQPLLFSLFGDAPLPVTLMESCAMLPKMSRSGLFGIRERAGSDTP